MIPDQEDPKESQSLETSQNLTNSSNPGVTNDFDSGSNDALIISLQQNQPLQEQMDLNNPLKNSQKIKPVHFDDERRLQKTFDAFNKELKALQASSNPRNKINANCKALDYRGFLVGYKFTGPDRKKLAERFIKKDKELLDQELKEEKKEKKAGEKNRKKLALSGEGVEGLKEVAEIHGAMSVDIASIGLTIGMKLSTSESGGDKPKSSNKSTNPFSTAIPKLGDNLK